MYYKYLLILVFILNVLLGIFVLLRDHKNQINVSFSLFVLSVAGWLSINFLSNQFTDYPRAFIFNKLIFLESPYISFALVYFSLVFPYSLFDIKIKHLFLLIIPVFISNIFTMLNLTITGINVVPGGVTEVIFGPAIAVWGFQFVAYILVSLFLLGKKYTKTKGHQHTQIQYVFLGIALLAILGTVTNFAIPLLYNNFDASNYGPFLSLFVLGFTAYAILKHNLLHIKVIATEAVVVLLLIILFTKLFIYQSTGELILDTIIMGLVSIFGALLIKSVLDKDKISKVAENAKNNIPNISDDMLKYSKKYGGGFLAKIPTYPELNLPFDSVAKYQAAFFMELITQREESMNKKFESVGPNQLGYKTPYEFPIKPGESGIPELNKKINKYNSNNKSPSQRI